MLSDLDPAPSIDASLLQGVVDEIASDSDPEFRDVDLQRALTTAVISHGGSACTAVMATLEDRGWAVFRLPGFGSLAEATRRRVAIGVAGMLGTPQPFDDRGRIVADILGMEGVRPRKGVSDLSGSARVFLAGGLDLHTDGLAVSLRDGKAPERFVGLWCVRPAADGGASVLVDATRVVDMLEADRRTEIVSRLLRQKDVPAYAGRLRRLRVLGEPPDPAIRYSRATIQEGITRASWPAEDPRVVALRIFDQALYRPELTVRIDMRTDDVLLVDNHRMVHGREGFTDESRHLLRIRADCPALLPLPGLP